MATHSRILAWEILWTEEPGGLQSMGSQSDSAQHSSLALVCKYLFDSLLCILLGVYLEVELLVHMVILCSIF